MIAVEQAATDKGVAQIMNARSRMTTAGDPPQTCAQIFEGAMHGARGQRLAAIRNEEHIGLLSTELTPSSYDITLERCDGRRGTRRDLRKLSGARLRSRAPDLHPAVEDEAPRKSADRWPPAVRTEYGRSSDEDRPWAASRRSPAEAQQSPVRCRYAERAADEGGQVFPGTITVPASNCER